MDKRLQFVARRAQRSHHMNRRRSRSVRFRDSLSRCPLHRIGQIILHSEVPLPIAGVKMLPAVAGRAAIVRLQRSNRAASMAPSRTGLTQILEMQEIQG